MIMAFSVLSFKSVDCRIARFNRWAQSNPKRSNYAIKNFLPAAKPDLTSSISAPNPCGFAPVSRKN